MEERCEKVGESCIEMVPRRDNSKVEVKIERGKGIRGERVREKDEGKGTV